MTAHVQRHLDNEFSYHDSPNTVWKEEASAETFGPVNRWKTKLSQPEIATLEALIGDCLEEFAYPLTTELPSYPRLDLTSMRVFYPRFFDAKLFLNSKTVLGRFGKGAAIPFEQR